MTTKEQKKAKSVRQHYLILLSTFLVILLAIFFVSEHGLPFGSQSGNKHRQTGITKAQEKWAKHIELPGLPNFHKVSDDLYRGAQPTAEGMKQLEKMGIKTVINLRTVHSDRDEMKDTGLSYEHIIMSTWNVENKDVVRFLQIVTDPNRTPVFVHCQYGADRTGTMCAIYRIVIQGWSKEEAIEEMTKSGFGYHSIWQNLPNYVRNINVQEIKQEASSNP
jgi:tyrosine-protein phosphatase SIW14